MSSLGLVVRFRFLLGLTGTVAFFSGGLSAQDVPDPLADRPVIGQGEVTADDVYVRSGPSLNHYTISKLKAGDRVRIVSETPEWLEIVPPEGTFSLVSGDYVDSGDGQKGIINGQNVRIRAGSLLNDNKYTVQTMLSKGAEVTILGKNPDGFLKIESPAGATLWISRQFIETVPGRFLKTEREAAQPGTPASEVGGSSPLSKAEGTPIDANGSLGGSAPPAGANPLKSETPGKRAAKEGSSGPATKDVVSVSVGALDVKSSAFDGVEMTAHRRELDAADADIRAEMSRPLLERRLQPLLARYESVAEQDEDELAKRYAQRRIEQVSEALALMDTVQKMRRVNEDAESSRERFLAERSKIPTTPPSLPSGLDAQGELRESAVYPAGRLPRRFRLVDPGGADERTIGYVEIPADFHQPLELYLNRYVGVRAAARIWQEGGADPIPVYVASELVALDPVKQAEERAATEGDLQDAGGQPRHVEENQE